MNLLRYLKSPNLLADILKTLIKKQVSHLGNYFPRLMSCLHSTCFSLHIFLGTLGLQQELSREEPQKVSAAPGLEGLALPMLRISGIWSYQQYRSPVDVSGLVSWLNEPEDL